MSPCQLVVHLESPYEKYDPTIAPVRDILIAGLSWETEYWPTLAVRWLEQGAQVDVMLFPLLERIAARKTFPQSLRHKATAIARKWARQSRPDTSP